MFITPFGNKLNHFECLKLANCLQFGLLSASIVSRFGYTMAWAFVCNLLASMAKRKNKRIKDLAASPETRVVGSTLFICFFD